MQPLQIKCSLPKHKKSDAISYCQECKIYMCQKCQKNHSNLFFKHQTYKRDKDTNDIFTGFCQEENHFDKLEFFCKTHNLLCCSACISKIKKEGKGQHTDCDICTIEEMKDFIKESLDKNIKTLEELSNTFEENIYKLKKIFERINENKNEIKINIQKIFINIRNTINEREIEILKEVDNKFDELFFREEIIKKSETLPLRIMNSLKKGKEINTDWNNDNKLNYLIKEFLKIEENIENINSLNENIQKYTEHNVKIKFNLEENDKYKDINNNLKQIGEIYNIDFKYTFKKCPLNINDSRKYLIAGENDNIFTKVGKNEEWTGAICEKELYKNQRHNWNIRIVNTKNYNIMIGIAPIDFNINSSNLIKCGWYYNCADSTLNSGPPYNYSGEYSDYQRYEEEIKVFFDYNERTFGFISNYYNEVILYKDIPIDKPLTPIILLLDEEDSIEISE